MKNWIISVLIGIFSIAILIGLSYASGWIGVHQTATIGKASENAKREVFEQTQSYVEGKRQAALKYYKEYQKASESQKNGIANIVLLEFANFDEEKYLNGELLKFIKDCKYK